MGTNPPDSTPTVPPLTPHCKSCLPARVHRSTSHKRDDLLVTMATGRCYSRGQKGFARCCLLTTARLSVGVVVNVWTERERAGATRWVSHGLSPVRSFPLSDTIIGGRGREGLIDRRQREVHVKHHLHPSCCTAVNYEHRDTYRY